MQAEGHWCLKDILSFGACLASDLPMPSFTQALFKVGSYVAGSVLYPSKESIFVSRKEDNNGPLVSSTAPSSPKALK